MSESNDRVVKVRIVVDTKAYRRALKRLRKAVKATKTERRKMLRNIRVERPEDDA